MNGRRVLLVLQKEVREALRDRRTLFVTLVLPILLYPALMIGLGTVTARQQGKLRDAMQTLALEGPVPAALREALEKTKGLRLSAEKDPAAALKAGRIHLVVRAAPDFPEVLAAGGTARLELLHDSANEPSAEARRKALEVVAAWRDGILKERLAGRGIDPAFILPVDVPPASATDVASATRRGAHVFGRLLSFMLVVMVVTGAFTPAVDAVAGEKERGTMETLLISPATRLEIVLGKFLSVFAVSVATALGNLASMGVTFGQFASSLGVRGKVDFTLDAGTAATIFVILLPLAALFSALALALSTLARSTKEAQTYLTPLMLLAMPLSMVAVVPNIDLGFGLAAVPVAGAVLLFRDLMLAQGEPALLAKVIPMVPVVLGATALAAGLAVRWAVWMFGREEVLFRDAGEAFSWKDLRASRREGSVPGPGGAFLLPAAALAATFLVGQAVLRPEWALSPWTLVGQQALLLAAVAAGISLAGLDPGATLGLRSFPPAALAGAVLLGCGSAVATPWLVRVTGLEPDAGGPMAGFLESLLRGHSLPVLLLLTAALPALAEETLFRGWVLRGLRSEMSGVAAILLSSVIFGVFHMEPERIAFTAALGAGLGFLALRTGSLWPGVVAHALHNGVTVGAAKVWMEAPETATAVRVFGGQAPIAGIAGLAAAGAGLLLVHLSTRSAPGARDSLGAPPPSG